MSDPAGIETEDQIFARLDTDPANAELIEGFNEGPRPLTADERIDSLRLRAKGIRETQLRGAVESPKRDRRLQFLAGIKQARLDFAKLDDETIAVSQLEFRRILKRAVRANIFLAEIMQDLGQIERDNGQ